MALMPYYSTNDSLYEYESGRQAVFAALAPTGTNWMPGISKTRPRTPL